MKVLGYGLIAAAGLSCIIFPHFLLSLFLGFPAIALTIGACILLIERNNQNGKQ